MCCPTCKWDPYRGGKDYKVGGLVLRSISDWEDVPQEGYQTWNENYKCPKCKTEFTEFSGT